MTVLPHVDRLRSFSQFFNYHDEISGEIAIYFDANIVWVFLGQLPHGDGFGVESSFRGEFSAYTAKIRRLTLESDSSLGIIHKKGIRGAKEVTIGVLSP